MLTYSQLGKKGNLGNQLFQIASVVGIAKKHNHEFCFPEWKYSNYFKEQWKQCTLESAIQRNEPHFHYADDWLLGFDADYDISGWLQSEKYWKDLINPKELFAFTDELIATVKGKICIFDKPVIAISIRRGDYVDNPNYEQLPASYYYLSLLEHFPDFRNYNLLFFSDDTGYCKVHFECLPNAFFAEDCSDIEQLCLMAQCNHFIIANSTFSWWGAYLGEKENSKIIRPAYHFAGKLLERSDARDYYPERWTTFDHKGKKLDLHDVTFTIPAFIDHKDRLQNISLSVCMLQRDFDTSIIVGEQGSHALEYMQQHCRYHRFTGMKLFHRTKMLNDMAMMADTEFIANYDCDVLIPPMQIWLTVEALRNGADMVYPFDGRMARVPRNEWFDKMSHHLDTGIFSNTEFKGKRGKPMPPSSVGGCVFFNKESFIDGGMENEKMISFAPEDCERWDRFHMLGFRVERINGALYHIDHWCGPDSSSRNPFFKANHAECDKIRLMNKQELMQYVDTWEWRHKYTENYYRRISESAIASAKVVYAELERMGYKLETIVDVGCGVGEWKHKNYVGIDHRIPKRSLLIPLDTYCDFDLTKADKAGECFEFGSNDLALCLEVAEHLPEANAASLTTFLCSLSNTVLFSAAIPYQGGVGHVNEQWQTYWAKLFSDNGYYPAERQLREAVANNKEVDVWYRQNIVLYEKGGKGSITDYVLPEMYENVVRSLQSV